MGNCGARRLDEPRQNPSDRLRARVSLNVDAFAASDILDRAAFAPFLMPTIRCCLQTAFFSVCLSLLTPFAAQAAPAQPPVVLLGKANALPLSINSSVEVRKSKTYFLETNEVAGIRGSRNQGSDDVNIAFERRRLLYGAVNPSDVRNRYGNYYTFMWRSKRAAHLTVRLEYRQQKLGALVQAREVDYPAGLGSHVTHFNVTGDDYQEQGRVIAWRLVVIEDHDKIVALKQSYLWR